ncbi:DUF3298 and DUF4163 domain-containing protein [Muricomes sp. OA1]|uniref:DUF3298/DUF4163 domain-containing protein n=1 Tax=Hungatella hathewayi TaxID=154046 RepID=A0A3E2WZ58_9FIRM|nr:MULTISPECIES: DUF3298 and DUF4163 domain-containing protein [Clostridia]MCH1974623.1 DUF3298 and DUF4163 domain-containing protein [Muricomes sp. OA1]RGC33058.1 DUF3298/DUF4163 domain-containing protein [Hungatella hathewayi]GKH33404.1 ferritin [Faecalicatena contorta]
MQTVFQKTLESTMYYHNIPVFIYKIRYPFFTTTCSSAAARKINQYYICHSRAAENYCQTVLFPQAVESARYIQDDHIPFNSYEMDTQFKITLNHDSIASLYNDQYTYMGGAHGMTRRNSDTWDFSTGYRICLRTIYSGNSSYPENILEEIERQTAERLAASPSSYFDNYPALIREHFNPQSYFLEPRSIVIYYQQYDIAPYATGIPEFRLPYPENITSCI